MRLWDVPVEDPRPLLAEERADLLALLADLSDADWLAPTEAGHWRVKDVALYLLEVDLDTGGCWAVVRDGDRWTLREGAPRSPAARLGLAAPVAWRQLTRLPVPGEQVTMDGDRSLVEPLLDVRGIIA
ncbi:MAG TPA: hypothetical protein VFZ79_21075 [Acidimicrobiales bacterium]